MSNIRVTLPILLLALLPATPYSGPQARNTGDGKKVEVEFFVTVRVTAHAKYEETSRGSGPDALPSTRYAADRSTVTIQGEHRWTLDAAEADNIIGGLMMEPSDFRISAEGGGSFTERNEYIVYCAGKKSRSRTGEDHRWTYHLTTKTEVPIPDAGLRGIVSIRHDTGTPGEGQFSVFFPLSSDWHSIETKGTAISWAKGCGESSSESKPIESAFSVDSPTLSRTAAQEAGDDEPFQGNLSGTFQTKDKRFSVTRHFSYRHDPERVPFDNSGSAGPEDGWTKSLEQRDATVDVTYTLSYGGSPDVEAIIIPSEDYDSWLPQAADDEKTIGSIIDVQVALEKKGKPGERTYRTIKSLTVELLDVSREKGVCLNWPQKDKAKDTFDLKIDPQQHDMKVADDGQSAKSTKEGRDSFAFIVNSYDWGAYGKVRARVTLDDGEQLVAHVRGGTREALTIPKDENDNHIADIWEKSYPLSDSNSDSDEDSTPRADNDSGDVLSLYEEYRGFMIQMQHVRTHPTLKDVFVVDGNGMGTGNFYKSGLAVRVVRESEVADEKGAANRWVINPNRGYGTLGPQYALKLFDTNLNGTAYGWAMSDIDDPSVPRDIIGVYVDVAASNKNHLSPEDLENTIAHELAHGCNVWHHGDNDFEAIAYEGPKRKAGQAGPNRGVFSVAALGGSYSGQENCIMRYYSACFYLNENGTFILTLRDGSTVRAFLYGAAEPPGTVFCRTDIGTGVNAPDRPLGPKAGNASRGFCMDQFCVNHLKHPAKKK